MVVKAKKNSGISGNGDQRLRKIENLLPGGANASTFEYGYDQEGVIQSWSRQLGAGAVLGSNFKYDLADQLTEAAVGTATTPVNHVWRYDPAGNRTSEQVDSLSTAYTSNNLNQVTSLAGGGPVRFEGMINEPGTVKVNGQSAIVAADNSFRVDVALPAGTQMVAVVATDASGNAATKNYQVPVGSAAARTFTCDLNGNTLSDGLRTYTWMRKIA